MDESDASIQQALVEYYRNKCNKLEHDFLIYQIRSQKTISELTSRINEFDKGEGS